MLRRFTRSLCAQGRRFAPALASLVFLAGCAGGLLPIRESSKYREADRNLAGVCAQSRGPGMRRLPIGSQPLYRCRHPYTMSTVSPPPPPPPLAEVVALPAVDPKRLVTSGHGESDPVASNATSDGRSQTLLADVAAVEAGAPDAPATNTTTRGDWTARMREARELFRLREYRQAEEKLLEAIAIGDDYGPTGQRVATTWILLERIADHYQDDRDVAGTARVGPTLIAVGSRIHGPSNPRLVPHRSALADALAAQGDLEAERGVLLEALAETSGDAKDDFTLRLARLEIEDSNPGAAGPLLEALLERNPPGPAAENAAVLRIASLHALAEVRALEARETEAEALFVQARDEASALAPGSTSLALVHKGLAAFYLEQDRGAEAEAEARAGLALLASHSGTEASQLEVQAMLAASLDRQARTLETEAAYDDGLALAESSPGAAAAALRAAYSEWLRSQGRGEDADRIAAPSGAPEAFPREPTG